MFSFIKWLQQFTQKLRRNKGLWFTMMTVVSMTGIMTSMYLMSSMSTNVAEQTYQEEKRLNLIQLNSYFHHHYFALEQTSSFLAQDQRIINNLKTRKYTATTTLLNTLADSLNNTESEYLTKIDFYANNAPKRVQNSSNKMNLQFAEVVMDTKETIEGIAINKDGVNLITITPIMDKNVTLGAIEVRKSIHAVLLDAELVEKEFAFIIDKNQLGGIDLQYKTGRYQDINEKYSVEYKNYTTNFLPHIKNLDMKQLFEDKYFKDDHFFTNYQELTDVSGKPIGIAFIGESTEHADSFVHIAQNMISTVTTIALGLIISLILFMF